MRHLRLSALLVLAVLAAGQARAGSISLAPSKSKIALGQMVDVTVSIDSTDPHPPSTRGLNLVDASLTIALNGGSGGITNFQLGSDLPAGSKILFVDTQLGSANVGFGANSLSSFSGAVYTVDYLPTAVGEYTFGFDPNGSNFALYTDLGSVDNFTLGPSETVTVVKTLPVPEPTSLTLAGACLGGLALRAWRRRTPN